MERIHNITLHFNVNLSEIQHDFSDFIFNKCNSLLKSNVYEGYIIKELLNTQIPKDKKINLNGTISVKVLCKCSIIDPILDSAVDVEINDINKMGYSYKRNKLCIFIPIHLCNEIYTLHQSIKIKIIGKRVEEEIVCIGQPV